MKITLNNQSDVQKITVKNQNDVGKVVFGRISKVEDLRLSNMSDVDTSTQQNNDVLVYDSGTNAYTFRPVSLIDGGIF